MATQISRNNSHRRLIKEKTNQLVELRRQAPKSELGIRATPITRASENRHSPPLNPMDTSIDERLKKESAELQAIGKPAYFVRRKMTSGSSSKASLSKFRSVQPAASKKSKSPALRANFSVRRMSVDVQSQHVTSLENMDLQSKGTIKEPSDLFKFRSENCLKHTLKKTSSKQLKIRVKDPFEKRLKLDNELINTSAIAKNDDSLILSTVNEQEFQELLSRIL